jgi:hypothetical protein
MPLDPAETALRLFLDQPDAVIFVGSGLSLWAGLPNWETLIRRLIDVASAKGSSTQMAEEDRIARGQIDYNHSNFSGAALATRLSGTLLDYFMETIRKTEHNDEDDARFGFQAPIAALPPDKLQIILRWANRQPAQVRGLICQAIREVVLHRAGSNT